MRRLLLILGLLTAPAWGATYYMAVGGAGAKTGANCANAYDTSHTIAGSDVIHWCGTTASALNATNITIGATQKGTVGNPTTIIFEPSAIMQSPAFNANGAIYINASDYVLIDGGTAVSGVCGTAAGGASPGVCNGIIQNTDNGTSLGNHQTSRAIYVYNSPHVEIRNVKAQHIYVATDGDTLGAGSVGIEADRNCSQLNIHNNDLSDAHTVVYVFWGLGGVVTDQVVAFNRIQNAVWGIADIGNSTGDTVTGQLIHDNEITNIMNGWTGNTGYHHDSMIIYTCAYAGCQNFYPEIYNNYIHDDTGGGTAAVFCTYGTTNGDVVTPSGTKCIVYNNLIVLGNVLSANAIYFGGNANHTTGNVAYNNTLVSTGSITAGVFINSCSAAYQPCGNVVKNNIIEGWELGISLALTPDQTFTSPADLDGNLYHNLRVSPGQCDGASNTTFYLHSASGYMKLSSAGWQGAGFDAHSTCTDADIGLSASYQISSTGSAPYHASLNLSSLGVSHLNSDALGVGRPAAGTNWDTGALQFVASGSQMVTLEGAGNANGKVCTDGTTCTDGILNAVMTAGVTTGTNTHSFTAGATATLTATATTGSFVTFSGGGCTTSPCTITVNSPLTITATFQTTPTCSLTFASNSINAPATASATTAITQLSGPNSLWFIFGPPPDNLPIFSCQYPYSGCNANGQTGNIAYVGPGVYTLGACSNGVCCPAGSNTQPLNIWTPVGRSAR